MPPVIEILPPRIEPSRASAFRLFDQHLRTKSKLSSFSTGTLYGILLIINLSHSFHFQVLIQRQNEGNEMIEGAGRTDPWKWRTS